MAEVASPQGEVASVTLGRVAICEEAPVKNVLVFVATLAVLAALLLLALMARNVARSVGIPPPFSGAVAGAVFGVALYAVAKGAARKFGA